MSLNADQTVEALRAAGEPTRLRVLSLLAGEELSVMELSRILDQSQPRVSRHLKLLADAGLVERFPDGAWVFYRLAADGPGRALADHAVALIDPADPLLRRDAERLSQVETERSSEAAAYFARNAARWDEIRSLYVAEAQVEREGELWIRHGGSHFHFTRSVAVAEEAGETAAFGFIGVHREGVIAAATGMHDMVGAAAEGALIPEID
jgi:DNA-binding transcriptional ArsR family regulator